MKDREKHLGISHFPPLFTQSEKEMVFILTNFPEVT